MDRYSNEERQILDWCSGLANSQGFYGRLYNDLLGNREYLSHLAEQGFKDILDFVLYVEGC